MDKLHLDGYEKEVRRAADAEDSPVEDVVAALRQAVHLGDQARLGLLEEVSRVRAEKRAAEDVAADWRANYFREWAASHPEDAAAMDPGNATATDSAWQAAMVRARELSEAQAKKLGLPVAGFPPLGRYCIVEDTRKSKTAEDMASRHGLRFEWPDSMHDVISWRRLSETAIIGLIGDDRGGGWWAIVVAWSPLLPTIAKWGSDRTWVLH